MSRWGVALAMTTGLLLVGCAGRPVHEVDRIGYSQRVDGQLLPVQPAGAGGVAITRHALQPHQLFRMPRALQDPAPVLPEQAAQRELSPTRVCARVAISAAGAVMFADNLVGRDECAAGTDPANAALVEAMLAAVRGWTFRPAAMCSYAAEGAPRDDPGECEGAGRIEPVPVTLEFAFTFEVHEGRVRVSGEGAAR